MKKCTTSFSLLLLCVFAVFLAGCQKQAPKQEVIAEVPTVTLPTEKTLYSIVPEESELAWEGSKIGGSHNGILGIKEGEFTIENQNITEGGVILNLKQIAVLDLEGKEADKLAEHFSAKTFFDVENFSEAAFLVSSVEKMQDNTYKIEGGLSIKGIINPISLEGGFMEYEKDKLVFIGGTTIDRQLWNLKFKGPGELAVSNDIEIETTLTLQKK